MEFKGKVAVITGGASGIGREVVKLLAGGGATVVVADIQEEAGNEFLEELKSQNIEARFVKTDMADINTIKTLFSDVISNYEKADFLINCAGISRLTSVLEITPQEWDLVMEINLKGTFFCSQEALRHMCRNRYGRIVNIASMAAKLGGVAVGTHYAASKAAIICVTKSLALYGASSNVNVNCVCPGPIATPLTDEWGDDLNREFAAKIPLKRYGTSEEVAHAVEFLLSDKAGYITGETIDINGGMLMD